MLPELTKDSSIVIEKIERDKFIENMRNSLES
jgi:hypothetical protein